MFIIRSRAGLFHFFLHASGLSAIGSKSRVLSLQGRIVLWLFRISECFIRHGRNLLILTFFLWDPDKPISPFHLPALQPAVDLFPNSFTWTGMRRTYMMQLNRFREETLLPYGFLPDGETYVYHKAFFNGMFEAVISIDSEDYCWFMYSLNSFVTVLCSRTAAIPSSFSLEKGHMSSPYLSKTSIFMISWIRFYRDIHKECLLP